MTASPATPAGAAPRAYTVAQVAALWGVSDTFVYSLVASGRLAGFKLGAKLWRIRPDAVEEYEARTAEAEPAPSPPPLPDAAKLGRLTRQPHAAGPASRTHRDHAHV